jgi:hypothetical protein
MTAYQVMIFDSNNKIWEDGATFCNKNPDDVIDCRHLARMMFVRTHRLNLLTLVAACYNPLMIVLNYMCANNVTTA